MKTSINSIILCALLTATLACPSRAAPPAGQSPAAGVGPAGMKSGQPVPAFVLKTLDGQDFYLRDYCGEPRGKRFRQDRNILVLSFFTTWCKNCKLEIPVLQEMASAYRDQGIQFYLVNVGQPKDTVSAYVFDQVISLPVLLDQYEVVSKKFSVKELPTLTVIGRDAVLAEYHTGYTPDYQVKLVTKLDSLLGKTAPAVKPAAGDTSAKAGPAKKKGKKTAKGSK